MYEFKSEFERKEKKYKIYLIVFIITVLIYIFDLGIEKTSGFRTVISLLFYGSILYFGMRRKLWAELIIKFFVWLHIIILFLIITVKALGL